MDDLSVESKTDMDDPAKVDDKINDEAIVGDNPSSIDEHVKGHNTSGDEPNIGENVYGNKHVLYLPYMCYICYMFISSFM